MQTFDQILKKIDKLGLEVNKQRIKIAYEFAKVAHEGQKRMSGESYIIHPLAVAFKVLDFSPDEDMIIAALLHDVSEDTDRTLDDIEELFGPGVRNLVRGLEKLSKVRYKDNDYEIENLRKMFISMAADLRVILIKLCDRWHNMETLNHVREEKQRRIALETMNVYVPIASRLGIYILKGALEDLCFKYLEPEAYENIDEQLEAYGKSRGKYIKTLEKILQKLLSRNSLEVKIQSRIKTHYSIYSKLKKKGKTQINEIFDVFALRVTVPTKFSDNGKEYTGDIYNILGVVHTTWTPLVQRFKDYVAVPKPNGYRSLHTTLIGMNVGDICQPVEIQIRSQLMHDEAEFGVASHWAYKESQEGDSKWNLIKKVFNDSTKEEKKQKSVTDWVQVLDELQAETESNEEFLKDLQVDLFNDRIFVLTPNGDVRDLPKGATPIDFAYLIHTDVGNRTYMAKVDGVAVSLDIELKNGQVVEIITRKNATPNQYWLSFVKTSGARNKIKNYFKEKDSEKNIKEGRDLLNKYLTRVGKKPLNTKYEILKNYEDGNLTYKEREKLLEDIGSGQLLASLVVKKIFDEKELLSSTQLAERLKRPAVRRKPKLVKAKNEKILVDGISDLPIKLAPCCSPKVSDVIVGFVTRGEGVTVHKFDCKVLNDADEDRLIKVDWEATESDKYQVGLIFEIKDRVGLLHDITRVLFEAGVNIVDISTNKFNEEDGTKLRNFVVEVKNYEQLNRMLDKLERVDSIISVKKVL